MALLSGIAPEFFGFQRSTNVLLTRRLEHKWHGFPAIPPCHRDYFVYYATTLMYGDHEVL